MVGIIIDVSIILLISLCTFIGYKQGLIKVAIKILSFIIAIVIAFALYKPVSNLIITKTSIDDTIKATITNNLNITKEDKMEEEKIDLAIMPTNITKSIQEEANKGVENLAEVITIKIIQGITILVIFVLVKIILKFIAIIADTIAKLPILKQFNKLGGTLYGILKGLIITYLIFAIILIISPLIDIALVEAINKSTIGALMYNNNILIKLIFRN